MNNPEIIRQEEIFPPEYELIKKIIDLWANKNSDMVIRDLLSITKTHWNYLMKLIKEMGDTTGDNRLQYEKYIAKQNKRSKELEDLRLYAQATNDLNTAIKCFQLESDIDKSHIEIGQKLGVLEGEVIKVEKTVKNTNSIEVLFENVPELERESAKNDMLLLVQEIMSEGIGTDEG